MEKTKEVKILEEKISLFETRMKHLENELRLTKEESDKATKNYFEIYYHMEKKVKERTAELENARKMETIGTLAGGVAHDLNNTLGAIIGYPDLLLDMIPENSRLRKSILAIKGSGERAAAIVQDFLTLTRRGIAVTEIVNINTLVSEFLKTREYEKLKEFHPDVEIETNLNPGILNVIGSPVHLSTSIMNLLSNAVEATPDGGKVIISTENRFLDKCIKGYDSVEEGDYVVISVADTGMGVSQEDLGKIFKPFYTKKKMGRSGTGLGMTVVWESVKDHNGYIDIESVEGFETTFRLYIPATRKKIRKTTKPVSIGEYFGNGETILVVDDVASQRDIATNLLKKLNYEVKAVGSGQEAVEYIKKNSSDLLVLDMIMAPGIDGLETYQKIIKIYPNQKAILVSGFSETARVKKAQKLGAGRYIRKPFTLEKIGMAVKAELRKAAE